jgi:hypothetical protein
LEPELIARMRLTQVSYNPFRGPSFYAKPTGDAVGGALMLIMLAKSRWMGGKESAT